MRSSIFRRQVASIQHRYYRAAQTLHGEEVLIKISSNQPASAMPGIQLDNTILLAVFFLVVSAGLLHAQESGERQVHGDATLEEAISPQTRAIYEADGEWVFVLTKKNPLRIKDAYATDLRAAHDNGGFNRILATVWTSRGKYSVEYYLVEDAPIYVYETFEYFEESAPQLSWRNFKGIAAWERRNYFNNASVGYVETVGRVEMDHDAASFISASDRLLTLLAERRPE